MSDIEKYSDATFESIKHTNADGQEYWLARELQAVLEYTQWRRFSEVIERAKESCKNSGYSVEDHFANVGNFISSHQCLRTLIRENTRAKKLYKIV